MYGGYPFRSAYLIEVPLTYWLGFCAGGNSSVDSNALGSGVRPINATARLSTLPVTPDFIARGASNLFAWLQGQSHLV